VELDDWVCRHREPADLDDLPCPVSGQLQRMDPLRELLHLAGTRRALLAAHDGSPPEVAPDPASRPRAHSHRGGVAAVTG
jgi:hypothetical protein